MAQRAIVAAIIIQLAPSIGRIAGNGSAESIGDLQ
jgi:hypothetical protein